MTLHTDLALRLLIAVTRSGEIPVALPGFSAAHRVSYNHVAKVGQALVHAGYLRSVRGRSGGMKLAMPPEDIRIGHVVRKMEPTMQMADCPNCVINRDCSLISPLDEAKRAFLDVLDRQTLADVARSTRSVAA
ncbi:RrF2 family transcriptional regulator [Croceicoccus bisphenolivorans]|uniref:RrF2 family transcriptional regulator n=1 Tax=Croceicoccus bisphenolivorans TaxID=1783232 RepID=UPI003CCC43B4